LTAIPADIPEPVIERLEDLPGFRLPRTWRAYPAPSVLPELGAAWIRAGRRPVLSVPSVVIPEERNYLIDPRHRQFGQIRVGKAQAFRFDLRMWKKQTRG
jgi:RES domain-containing protein